MCTGNLLVLMLIEKKIDILEKQFDNQTHQYVFEYVLRAFFSSYVVPPSVSYFEDIMSSKYDILVFFNFEVLYKGN